MKASKITPGAMGSFTSANLRRCARYVKACAQLTFCLYLNISNQCACQKSIITMQEFCLPVHACNKLSCHLSLIFVYIFRIPSRPTTHMIHGQLAYTLHLCRAKLQALTMLTLSQSIYLIVVTYYSLPIFLPYQVKTQYLQV